MFSYRETLPYISMKVKICSVIEVIDPIYDGSLFGTLLNKSSAQGRPVLESRDVGRWTDGSFGTWNDYVFGLIEAFNATFETFPSEHSCSRSFQYA